MINIALHKLLANKYSIKKHYNAAKKNAFHYLNNMYGRKDAHTILNGHTLPECPQIDNYLWWGNYYYKLFGIWPDADPQILDYEKQKSEKRKAILKVRKGTSNGHKN